MQPKLFGNILRRTKITLRNDEKNKQEHMEKKTAAKKEKRRLLAAKNKRTEAGKKS